MIDDIYDYVWYWVDNTDDYAYTIKCIIIWRWYDEVWDWLRMIDLITHWVMNTMNWECGACVWRSDQVGRRRRRDDEDVACAKWRRNRIGMRWQWGNPDSRNGEEDNGWIARVTYA